MNVMIIARGYPSKDYKMNGIFEFDQAKALTKNGVNVIFVAADTRSIRRWRIWGIEKKEICGVKILVFNIPCGRIPRKLHEMIKIWAIKVLYKIVVKEYGVPDIIHSHFIINGYVTLRAFENNSIPLILTEHYSAMSLEKLDPYYQRLGEYSYHKFDKVIAVSNFLAANIKKKFNVVADVVPNMVDLSVFEGVRNLNSNHRSEFRFVSVGRLHPIKNMSLLIKSFHKVFRDNKDVRLVILGEGFQRKSLEKEIIDFKLQDQVFLMGLVDRETIAKQLSLSDCFVLASKSETFGVAFVEAMSMGLPVIATRNGGVEDFIDENNGLLIPVDDQSSLENALLYMYENSSKYNSRRIAERVRDNYSENKVTETLLEIYQRIILKNKQVKG
jgi:L-malate glycosyltransferase